MIRKKMNKRAQGSILTILMVVAFFMFGILIIGLLFPDISLARASDSLDCSNLNISSGNKIACIGVDFVVPAFIIVLVIIGGGAIVSKLVGG